MGKTTDYTFLFSFDRVQNSFMSHLGRMIFSLGSSEAKSLKVLNLTDGG